MTIKSTLVLAELASALRVGCHGVIVGIFTTVFICMIVYLGVGVGVFATTFG